MNRRLFLRSLAASALTARLAPAQSTTGEPGTGAPNDATAMKVQIGSATGTKAVPDDFLGLSYEAAQLANPTFFTPENRQLIALFRELAPSGNLRIGGGSSEFTTYSDDEPQGPPPFEVFGPDTSKTVKHGTVTSALALRNLRKFLDAVNWTCLYGLNLGQGTVENAVREGAAVHAILGPRLMAFQIGNEPDSFRRRYRPETYEPADYLAEWNRFRAAIVEKTPEAKFAGPDISNKLAYLTAFAAEASKHPDVILLTSHYYAMGPASNPQATLENLLDPDPKLTTLKRRDLHVIAEAREVAHLPYRMSEGNSCWDGGKPGVSDTFASALWCADYLLTCMGREWAGVNLHGGGNGFYTPIAGAPSAGFTRRPEFFGIQFAREFLGSHVLAAELTGADPKVSAFGFERNGVRQLVVVNKTAAELAFALPAQVQGAPKLLLRGPAIDAKQGVEIVNDTGPFRANLTMAPYTAATFELRGALNT